jgi:hypothetical protein
MDTFPDSPPAPVAADLAALRVALDQSGIPPKSLDRNVLIATWNIRGFGKVLDKWESAPGDSPRRNLRDVLCLASIISRFDVVALQEVKRDLGGLRRLMEALGPNWAWILTDFTRGSAGNQERMAFVFDLRRVRPSGACGRAGRPDRGADLADRDDDAEAVRPHPMQKAADGDHPEPEARRWNLWKTMRVQKHDRQGG